MAYAQFDDGFAEHPTNDALSDSAFRLHVAGICFANRYLTDGLIPAERVPRLMPRFRKAALAELLTTKKWLPILDGACYEIRDYLDWNPSRAEVESRKEAKAERMRQWRREHGK